MGKYGRIIGLTGKIASGKSTVSQFLEEKGFFIVNVDSLGHKALTKAKKDVIKIFGSEILDSSGEINRQKLGQLVFSDPPSLVKLEEILHPLMRKDIQETLRKNLDKNIILEAALLYRMKLDTFCEKILVTQTCWIFQIYRLCRIRKIPFLYALKILRNQKKLVPKNPKNVMIKNSRSLSALSRSIDQLNLS